MSDFGEQGPTLGAMIVANSQPAPPPPVVEPPPPVTPGTASEATARLKELKADPAWRDAYLGGSPRHAKEMASLHDVISKGDNPAVDLAIAGVLYDAPFQPSGHIENIAAASMFRDHGIRDAVIRETLADHEVTQAEYDAVAQLKAERLRDRAWVKEFMAGNGQHTRDMMLMSIVLSSTIKTEVAA